MCFMTPKRDKCGKASTSWVVVRGPCRKRSRIARLVLSDKTVRNHVSAVLTKLQVASRAEAVALARDVGLGPSR